MNRAGVPCGTVMSLAEVYDDPQIQSQEMVLDVPHPGHGTVRMNGFPLKFKQAPCGIRHPAPDLGADTADILRETGYDEAAIAEVAGPSAVSAAAAHR